MVKKEVNFRSAGTTGSLPSETSKYQEKIELGDMSSSGKVSLMPSCV